MQRVQPVGVTWLMAAVWKGARQSSIWRVKISPVMGSSHLVGQPNEKSAFCKADLNAGTAVLQAVEQAVIKPRVLIQSSAVGYYGPRGAEAVTEDTSPSSDFLADVCVQWEKSTEPVEKMGVRRVTLRTGVVLTMEGMALRLLVMPIKLFVGGPLGGGRQYVPWIHLEDEVRAIRFLLENHEASGPYNLSAPTPLTNAQFGKAIAGVLKRPFYLPIPAFALKLAFGELATIILDGQRAVPEKLQKLGYTYQYGDIKPALEDLLTS